MIYIKLGNTEISVDKAQWCDSEGLLVPWHFPCLFWQECDAGHCDLTDGQRSMIATHCCMPELVSKTGEDKVKADPKPANFKVEVGIESELTSVELAEDIASVLQDAIIEIQTKKMDLTANRDSLSDGEFNGFLRHFNSDFELLRNLQKFSISREN